MISLFLFLLLADYLCSISDSSANKYFQCVKNLLWCELYMISTRKQSNELSRNKMLKLAFVSSKFDITVFLQKEKNVFSRIN